MKSSFKIWIPNPCHENWDEMTPVEQGRFCKTCATTVVDFTNKSTTEIQQYFRNNDTRNICVSLKKQSIDDLVLRIPEEVFAKKYSFDKLFLLALLVAMGTSLFSCNDVHTSKSINAIEIIGKDSIERKLEEEKAASDWKKMVEKWREDSLQNVDPSEVRIIKPNKDRRIIIGPLNDDRRIIAGPPNTGFIIEKRFNALSISEKDFKKKLVLVSQKKLSAGDFKDYLGDNLYLPVLVNGGEMTFKDFCKIINDKKIEIKKLTTGVDRKSNAINRMIIEYIVLE